MKNRQSIQHIIKRYIKGKANKHEKKQLFSFYKYIESQEKEKEWDEVKHGNREIQEYNLWKKIDVKVTDHDQRMLERTFRPLRRILSIAASMAIAVLGAIYLFVYQSGEKIEATNISVVQPGSDKAILLLANGLTVNLDSMDTRNISFATGATILMKEKGALDYTNTNQINHIMEMNTIIVPRGGKFKVTLSDGTSVWLNSSSSITYPVRFFGNERRVKLTGEAYFEVAKQTKEGTKTERVPFIVETAKQQVEVLGTIFNINAYTDEQDIKTTLIEGSVKISAESIYDSKTLKPGQQSILNNGRITIQEADIAQSIAWKRGDFTFDAMPLEQIMRQISRWYDVEIIYKGNIDQTRLGGSISRSKDIQEVLDVLKLTGIHFNLKGRRIMIKP